MNDKFKNETGIVNYSVMKGISVFANCGNEFSDTL